MNVSLTPELEKLVQEKVASGLYQTASEVIREGLRLLKERDERQKAALREAIQDGPRDQAREAHQQKQCTVSVPDGHGH